MKSNERINIIVVNNQAETLEPFFNCLEFDGINCKVNNAYNGIQALTRENPFGYHFAIIDASTDTLYSPGRQSVEREHTLSETWKSQNPELIIVGTSVQASRFEQINGSYDETLIFSHLFSKEFKEILRKYGFIEQEAKV